MNKKIKTMKKALILFALAVVLMPLTAFAQSNIFKKYSDNNDVTYVSIKPKMFQMLAKMDVDTDDPEAKEFLDMVKSITSFKTLATDNKVIAADINKWVKSRASSLEELMEVKDDGVVVKFYVKEGKNYDLVLDIQGDEPLISPYHIDEIIKFHEQNKDADIILPTLKVVLPDNPNVVKVVSNKKNEVLYLSRAKIPYESKLKCRYFLKHLSIISFKPEALIKFAKAKRSYLEKIEDIELLRALEIGLKIKTVVLKGDSFSVDVIEDYERAKDKMLKDKFFKLYK